MKRILFLVFLFAASVLQAAEFEVVDQLTVNGATTLKSSVVVIVPNLNLPLSLWVSTSAITPHLYVSTNGNIGIGTIFQQSKLDVEGGVAIGATYSGTSAAPSNGLIVEGNVGIGTTNPTSKLQIVGLPVYANNAAAIAGGLTAGALYRTGADPDPVYVVH